MSIATYSGHVLLPHRPDWRQRVEWNREWETSIRSAVAGNEARVSMRPRARIGLKYRIIPFDHVEAGLFVMRAREVANTGRAVVPYWGRGVALRAAALAGETVLQVTHDPTFEWEAGDFLLLGSALSPRFDQYEVVQLSSIPGNKTVVLSVGTASAYSVGSKVHALLFGRCEIGDGELLDDWHGGWSVTMSETAVRATPEH